MKRHAVAILLQPYKNRLMARSELKGAIDGFAGQLLDLCAAYQNFHFNIALPAYILELLDPLLLSKLRDTHVEWLLTGYTEPFVSFSPLWLTEDNIRRGIGLFSELTGIAPAGFVPPFSNWEPSLIGPLRAMGMNCSVVSAAALPPQARNFCGYWTAEHTGNSIALFPAHVLHHYSAPADFIDWLEKLVSRDERPASIDKIATVHYLLPLQPESGTDPYRWLNYATAELDKHLLRYQPVFLQEALSLQDPAGLQHLPASLPLSAHQDEQEPHYFLNRLRLFDQVGIMQRKLMEICDRVVSLKDHGLAAELKRRLFFLQDINRYLPAANSGFTVLSDRMWTYGQLIEIDSILSGSEGSGSGRIQITDFLRNGSKSIIMSNGSLKAFLDHKNGGRLFELDYYKRAVNLFASFNPLPRTQPDIISPSASLTAFIDRVFPEHTAAEDIVAGRTPDTGNFAEGAFEYKIKKTADSIKTIMSRQGYFLRNDKPCPLNMEKVFGLEKDSANLSFVYQLANPSLAYIGFVFAVELTLSLPGAADRNARLINGKTIHAHIGWEPVTLEKTATWSISDFTAGIRLEFVTQKPLDICILPVTGKGQRADPACGTRILLLSPVALEPSMTWQLTGVVNCRKIRERRKNSITDAL
jgi:hypothetical protein